MLLSVVHNYRGNCGMDRGAAHERRAVSVSSATSSLALWELLSAAGFFGLLGTSAGGGLIGSLITAVVGS